MDERNLMAHHLQSDGVEVIASPMRSSSSNRGLSRSMSTIPDLTPRSRMKRTQSVLDDSSPIDRVAEGKRWGDVIKEREQHGVSSPLKIHVNPLRLFDPTKIENVTGKEPVFDVALEDPFLNTPDRKERRQVLHKRASKLTFSLDKLDENNNAPAAAETKIDVAPPTTARKAKRNRIKRSNSPAVAALVTSRRSHGNGVLDVEIPSDQRTPRWASEMGAIRWVMECGNTEDKRMLALSYRRILSAKKLMYSLNSLFLNDISAERATRRGILEFIGLWMDVMPFHSTTYQDGLMGQLNEFLSHTSELYLKMVSQRHTQAHLYGKAPFLLQRLQDLRVQVQKACTSKCDWDERLYIDKTGEQMSLRPDSDALALVACMQDAQYFVAPVFDNEFSILKMDSKRMALAITHVDQIMFSSISGYDLIKGSRNGPAVVLRKGELNGRPAVRVHSIVNITSHWNKLSRWVPHVVLNVKKGTSSEMDNIKVRAKAIKKFIELATDLHALGNWSAFFAIMIGLGSSTISCLKESWKLVSPKHVTTFRDLEEACQPMSNFRIYREAISKGIEMQQFCIPYMAIVLKDLQAVEEGNPTRNDKGWYNFEKMQLLAAVLDRVRQVQQIPCPIRNAEKKLVQYVLHVQCSSESDLWDQSAIVKANEQAATALQQSKKLFVLKKQ